jgi:hypothetical protein
MALESTQLLTEMSTRNLPGGTGRPARKTDNLTTICGADRLEKRWNPRRLITLWAFTACYSEIAFYIIYYYITTTTVTSTLLATKYYN